MLKSLVLVLLLLPAAAAAEDDPILDTLSAELSRAMRELAAAQGDTAPYYISAELVRTHSVTVRGEDGALHGYEPTTTAWLDVDVRIGSPQLDSSHPLRKEHDRGARWRTTGVQVPADGDPVVLAHLLWKELDLRFGAARARWASVSAEAATLVVEEQADDLVDVAPVVDLQEVASLSWDAEGWEDRARRASAAMANSPSILDGSTSMSGSVQARWFVDTQGTQLRHSEARYRASVSALGRAEDGAELRLHALFDGDGPDDLPGAEGLVTAASELSAEMDRQLAAPAEEPYNGPAILSDRAAGVFFHEVFGHRVEGARLKQINDAQTFRNQVGEQILPSWLSVYDDPTVAEYGGHSLRGHYAYDNQGVPATRTVLVQDGVLRGFLQSRSPVRAGDVSNGHGRRQAGRAAASRQGNLMIEARESHSNGQLRDELLKLVRAEGLDYGLVIDEIAGGFTFTGRTIPNAFNVIALRSYRVYADGRPDELVRGVDLIGTPLEAFSNIAAAGERVDVFNGNCGAESGWVPVSASAPSLLLRRVETQRKAKGQDMPPILPPPGSKGGAS